MKTDQSICPAPSPSAPPAVGQSCLDPVFGTTITRLTDAMNTPDHLTQRPVLGMCGPEYATVCPWSFGNKWLFIETVTHFRLHTGTGGFVTHLPIAINPSAEPRWTADPDVLCFLSGNELRSLNVMSGEQRTLHRFSEYSSISGAGESDVSEDGDHVVLCGNRRDVFVYEISTNTKGPVLMTDGRFNALYITPDNNVLICWNKDTARGIEIWRPMTASTRVKVAPILSHNDVTRDARGDEVLVWANSPDPGPLANCANGIVKIHLKELTQTCLLSMDWSLAQHVSAPDRGGFVFVETYGTPDSPHKPYTGEILRVWLDGSRVERLCQHRSRSFPDGDNYTWQPKTSCSRDGSRILFASNWGQNPAPNYTDAYLIDLQPAVQPVQTTPIVIPSREAAPTPPPPSTAPDPKVWREVNFTGQTGRRWAFEVMTNLLLQMSDVAGSELTPIDYSGCLGDQWLFVAVRGADGVAGLKMYERIRP